MTYNVSPRWRGEHEPSSWFLMCAGLAGCLHAAITLYWALGGRALLWTLGQSFLAHFTSVMWILYPLGLLKAVAALAPLLLSVLTWPQRRIVRGVCWSGALVLIAWGGANTVVGNLVLMQVVRPDGGFDRSTMIGHAWLWDPLFLVWGMSLAAGLYASRNQSEGGDSS